MWYQSNEPCAKCRLAGAVECEYYNSSAMTIFGACGHKQLRQSPDESWDDSYLEEEGSL